MDLIEVLWKQDVDLGFSLDFYNNPGAQKETATNDTSPSPGSSSGTTDEIEKIKILNELNASGKVRFV